MSYFTPLPDVRVITADVVVSEPTLIAAVAVQGEATSMSSIAAGG